MYQAPNVNRQGVSFREFVTSNPTLFGSTPTDDFRWEANISGTPSRPTRTSDTTAYATAPTQDSWRQRWFGDHGPARPTAPDGVGQQGTAP